MAVMPTDNMLTREELDALDDDGLRHELIDGAFVMTPSPGSSHQGMVGGLHVALRTACLGSDFVVRFAPLDVVLGSSVVQPDLVVARASAFTERGLATVPLLVVEVRSLASGWLDQGRKLTLYEENGVAHYWLVDPVAPFMTVLDLVEGRYVQTATATGDQSIELIAPFEISLNPVVLAQG